MRVVVPQTVNWAYATDMQGLGLGWLAIAVPSDSRPRPLTEGFPVTSRRCKFRSRRLFTNIGGILYQVGASQPLLRNS